MVEYGVLDGKFWFLLWFLKFLLILSLDIVRLFLGYVVELEILLVFNMDVEGIIVEDVIEKFV